MFSRISRKLIVVFATILALVLLAGLGTALAAQQHRGATAFAASTTASTAPLVAYATPGATAKQQRFIGIVQSIDQAKKTFTLLVTGQTKAITITFDAKTVLSTRQHVLQLTAKAHVLVDVTVRSDGSLYATKIEPASMAYHRYRGGMHAGPHGVCAPGTRPRTRPGTRL